MCSVAIDVTGSAPYRVIAAAVLSWPANASWLSPSSSANDSVTMIVDQGQERQVVRKVPFACRSTTQVI
jgi:hypothetical protein